MKWEDDILNKTKQFGIHGYPLSKCLLILDIDNETDYAAEFQAEGTDIHRAYMKGVAFGEFAFDNILFKKGTEGDIASMKEYEKRVRTRKIRE